MDKWHGSPSLRIKEKRKTIVYGTGVAHLGTHTTKESVGNSMMTLFFPYYADRIIAIDACAPLSDVVIED